MPWLASMILSSDSSIYVASCPLLRVEFHRTHLCKAPFFLPSAFWSLGVGEPRSRLPTGKKRCRLRPCMWMIHVVFLVKVLIQWLTGQACSLSISPSLLMSTPASRYYLRSWYPPPLLDITFALDRTACKRCSSSFFDRFRFRLAPSSYWEGSCGDFEGISLTVGHERWVNYLFAKSLACWWDDENGCFWPILANPRSWLSRCLEVASLFMVRNW